MHENVDRLFYRGFRSTWIRMFYRETFQELGFINSPSRLSQVIVFLFMLLAHHVHEHQLHLHEHELHLHEYELHAQTHAQDLH